MAHPRRAGLLAAIVTLMATMTTVVVGNQGASGATPTCPTDTLSVGQRIEADTSCSELRSSGGHFELDVMDNNLTMDQWLRGAGEPTGQLDIITGATWLQWTYKDISRRYLSLSMRRDGNLVLVTPDGTVLWSTNTTGSGATHAILQDNGRLVLLTAAEKRVWTSHSGIYALGGSDRVGPGGHLMTTTSGWRVCNNYCYPGLPNTLYTNVNVSTMEPDGDFVSFCTNSTRIHWHTNTHVPGSSLALLESGALVVESPTGRILWSSPTRGWRDAFSTMGTSVTAGTARFWYANSPVCP